MSISQSLINSFIVVVLLVGCSSINTTTVPTSTIVSLTPSLSNSIKNPTPVKNSPLLTATPRPSATPDLTETAFAQEKISTQIAEQTLVAQYPRACENPYFPREFSPNGSWMVESCYSENDESLVLTLSSRENQNLWKLVYRDYIQQGDSLPDGGLAVVHWSNDGRYVYFNSFVSGSGGECFFSGSVLNYGKGLFRLDLETGASKTILPLRENFVGYEFSFSSTGRRLAYETYLSGVEILDLKTGYLIAVPSMREFDGAGGFLWSPDGLQFVYSTVKSINYGESFTYSLRSVSAQTGGESIILESQDSCFAVNEWTENNILTIESYDENYDRTIIDFDLNSNEIISEVTATPFP